MFASDFPSPYRIFKKNFRDKFIRKNMPPPAAVAAGGSMLGAAVKSLSFFLTPRRVSGEEVSYMLSLLTILYNPARRCRGGRGHLGVAEKLHSFFLSFPAA